MTDILARARAILETGAPPPPMPDDEADDILSRARRLLVERSAEEERRAAARARLEAARAGGDEQWRQIEEAPVEHPLAAIGNQVVADVRNLGKAGIRAVEGVGNLARGAGEAAGVALQTGSEAPTQPAGMVGLSTPGMAVPFREEPNAPAAAEPPQVLQEVGQAIRDVAGYGAQGEMRDVQSPAFAREKGYIPADFWEGMKKDPVRTLAISGVENLGPLAATMAATWAAGPSAGLPMAFSMEMGGAYNEAKAEGASDEEALQAAGTVGAANAALEYLPLSRIVGKLAKGAPRAEVTRVVRDALTQAAIEGGTESLQELNNILVARATYAEEQGLDWEDAKRVLQAGVIGTVLGGGVAVGAGAVAQPQATPEQEQESARPAQPAADTPPLSRPAGVVERAEAPPEPTPPPVATSSPLPEGGGVVPQEASPLPGPPLPRAEEAAPPSRAQERTGSGLAPEAIQSWIDRLGKGKPGLSYGKVDGATSVVYRDPKGKPVAGAVLNADDTATDLLFTDKSRGALGARGAVAVMRDLGRRGVMVSEGEVSSDAIRARLRMESTERAAAETVAPAPKAPAPASESAPVPAPPVETPATTQEASPTPQAAPREPWMAPGRVPPPTENYLTDLSGYTARLYRETDIESAMELIPASDVMIDTTPHEPFFANTPNLALGQGENRGVLLEFDAAGLQGRINTAKPAWQPVWQAGEAEFVGRLNPHDKYQSAVRSITVLPDATGRRPMLARMKMVTQRLEERGWQREDLEGGGYRLTRPDAVAAPQAAPERVIPPERQGLEGRAFTASGTEVPFRWAVVDAAELTPSHDTRLQPNAAFPAELQPRQRERAASREQIEGMAQKLEPERLGESPSAAEGAPIVGPDFVVESGNARTIAVTTAYERGKGEPYRQMILDRADRYGIKPEALEGIERPVLVRVRQGEADRARLAQEMNEPAVATMSATEKAAQDATRLTPEMLEGLRPTDAGEFNMSNSADFIRGFQQNVVPQTERGGMVDERGQLSQQGRDRIRNAVFVAAYGDAEVAGRLIETDDAAIKSLGQALFREAPRVAKLRQAFRAGDRNADLDIMPDVMAAARKLDDLRRQGVRVDDYLAQGELLGAELSPEARAVLETVGGPLGRSAKKMADVLRRYQELVDAAGNPKQASLAAVGETPTRRGLWQEAVESHERAGQGELFDEPRARLAAKRPEDGGRRRRQTAPGWLRQAPESKGGKKVVEAIRKDEGGRRAGVRTIADFLIEETNAELRVGREQTTASRPAHYEPSPHMIRSRTANNLDYIAHETGHALSSVVRDKNPKAFNALKKDLIAIAERPGSMASRKSAEEGLAEWVRLSVVDPEAVAGEAVTAQLEAILQKEFPETLTALRDAARAYDVHLGRDLFTRFRSHSRTRPTPRPVGEQIRDAWHRALFLAGPRRSAIDRLDRNVWRAVRQAVARGAADHRTAYESVRRFFARTRDTDADLRSAYQSVLHATQEVEGAFGGRAKNERQGLRIRKTGEGAMIDEGAAAVLRDAGLPLPEDGQTRHGDWLYLTDHPVQDVVERLGKQWEDFETYAQARVALDRFQKRKHEYPGYPNDPSPGELERVVNEGNSREGFEEAFADLQQYADALLSVGVLGGMVDPEAAARMKEAYDDYLPLIREQERELGFSGASPLARPAGGFRRAFGGQQPFLPLLDALRVRTNQVLGAYYANRAVMAPIRAAEAAAKDTSLPKDVRDVVGRVATHLKLDQEIVAKLKPDEAQKIIADYLSEEPGETVKPEDVDVHWNAWNIWRATEPKAIQVVSPVINGRRVFYQIEDPILYDFFAYEGGGKGGKVSEIFDLFARWATGMTAPWKRAVTQNLLFASKNLPRDSVTGNFFGEDTESFIPAFYTLGGLTRQLTGRVPEGSSGGELLSRVVETTHSPGHRTRIGKFKEIIRLGVIPDDWRRLSMAEKIAELAGPIPMAAALKPVELGLWATGQRYIAQLSEEASRIEAYAQTLKRGGSHEAAQQAYDYVTGNFLDQPGSHFVAQLYRIPGFINPAVNITYEIGNRLTHPDPKVRAKHWAKAGPWLMTVTAIGWAINRLLTPDDKEKELDEREDEDKMSYMVIGGYLRVPFDYGLLGAVQSWTWNTLDKTAGGGPRGKVMARLLLKRATDLPIGGPMSFMQPQIKALLENEANYQWHWADEIEPHWMKYLPPEDRAYYTTPKVYRMLAARTGVGPLKVQHFVQAGMAYQLDEAIRWLDGIGRGERIDEAADVPFIGRLFQRQPRGWSSASVQQVAELDEHYATAKERLDALIDDPGSRPEDVEAAREVRDSLRAFNRGMRDIRQLYKDLKEAREAGRMDEVRAKEREMTAEAARVVAEAAGATGRIVLPDGSTVQIRASK